MLGVNTSDAKDELVEVIENAEIEFPNILDTTTDAQMAMMKYETLSGSSAVPMTYVIDREGNVIDAWYGYEQKKTEDVIKKLKLSERQ